MQPFSLPLSNENHTALLQMHHYTPAILSSKILPSKTPTKPYRPITPTESTIRSLQPMQRQWDHFWSEIIQVEGSQAKRHILMASQFKKVIVALREYGEKNNLIKEMHRLYAKLLQEYYEEHFHDQSLEYLETLIFYTLHNLKFNIFIGCHHWNGGINDTLCRIQDTEKSLLNSINESITTREIKRHIKNWQDENILIKKRYKDAHYRTIRIAIQKIILSLTHVNENHVSLDLIKRDLIERIQSIYDSLAIDLSQAQKDHIRKWQNSSFIIAQGNLTKLAENPSIDQAETLFREILKTNENGARFLGIDLSELDEGKPSAIHSFQNAITSNEPH